MDHFGKRVGPKNHSLRIVIAPYSEKSLNSRSIKRRKTAKCGI